MSAKRLSVKAKKPISVWKKPVKLNFKDFFVAVSNATYHGATSNWKGVADDVVKGIGLIDLKTTAGEIAWTLVCRSLVRAMFDLIGEMVPFPAEATPPDQHKFLLGVEQTFEKTEVVLEPGFFRRPADLPVLEALKQPMHEWLVAHGAAEPEARCIVQRLPSYFVYALHDEWQKQPADYKRLEAALETPFTRAGEHEEAWERYSARLQRQINEPMFGEAFGLAIVYVPLRGFYEEDVEKVKEKTRAGDPLGPPHERVRNVVVDLDKELSAWLERGDKDDALRVIAGGPGSGKSSFARWFAASQTAKGRRVLYVPLHMIDLADAIGQFVTEQDILKENPLAPKTAEKRLLLLLDGLDELAMQGKAAAEVAQKFILEIQRMVANRNHAEARVQVLVGGREIVVQMSRTELRKPHQVLRVLPYFVAEELRDSYYDQSGLLAIDQRDLWWANYAAAKGRSDAKMPQKLRRADLDEVTAQPLLGYLVALSYERGNIDFKKEVNRNEIYADLIAGVHARSYGDKPHPAVRSLELAEFSRLLEEVGIAVWHGDGRTATSGAIFRRCQKCGLDRLLDTFEDGAKSGATRLLTAFYFRQRGTRNDGVRTFEFTHKSFGEYLIAKRIVRVLEDVHEEMERRIKGRGRGWDERDALLEWAQIFGHTPIDRHILRFLRDEVQRRGKERAGIWQLMLAGLIGWMLRHGMPVDKLEPRPSYPEEARQARNAEEALLGCVHACALTTGERTVVDWPERTAFGAWIRRLQGQRSGPENVEALSCLGLLSLRGVSIDMLDLYGATLIGADLSRASCHWVTLATANLHGAILERANLQNADMGEATLVDANLRGAALTGANLMGANLSGADLTGTNLRETNLVGAQLKRAQLEGAKLRGAQMNAIGKTLESTEMLDPTPKVTD